MESGATKKEGARRDGILVRLYGEACFGMQGKGKGMHKGQMRKIVRKAVENRFIIILSLLALGIFYAVNLRPGIIKGSDDSFHLCR